MRFRLKHSLISEQIILRTNQIESITSYFKTNVIKKKIYLLEISLIFRLKNNELEVKGLCREQPEPRNPVMRFYR